MKSVIILLLVISVQTWAKKHFVIHFKNATSDEGRIVNGFLARRGQFPWQAAVFHRFNGRKRFCGGALISDQWVLTAGHCVYRSSKFRVLLGGITAYDEEPGKIALGVSQSILHPFYRSKSLNNDVALLKLERSVEFTDQIQPIRLAKRGSYLPPNYRVTVSGWGKRSDFASSISNKLYFSELLTISNRRCLNAYNPSLIRRNVVCCDSKQVKSTCNGDSGGPLVIKDEDGEPTHVGIVSFVSSRGCSKGYPSGFMRTASFLDFVEEETGIDSVF